MLNNTSWLEKLTLTKLHRLAVLIGSPCTGTKAKRIEGIQKTLQIPNLEKKKSSSNKHLSVVSVDMGIRNLAYAHMTADLVENEDTKVGPRTKPPTLHAWRRFSATTNQIEVDQLRQEEVKPSSQSSLKESFEPIDYAGHAYNFVKSITTLHKPTHILIERQRFRSGGHSSVQEWTIRVGVFEGMLYAALKTLAEETKSGILVEPMLPTRVNQYWFRQESDVPDVKTTKSRSQAMKKAKIDVVGGILDNNIATKIGLNIEPDAKTTADAFLARWKKAKQRRRQSQNLDVVKLDDLSDCLLQGMTWIEWQDNRQRLQSLGSEAFDLEE